jgi:hypothetical protein
MEYAEMIIVIRGFSTHNERQAWARAELKTQPYPPNPRIRGEMINELKENRSLCT